MAYERISETITAVMNHTRPSAHKKSRQNLSLGGRPGRGEGGGGGEVLPIRQADKQTCLFGVLHNK